ncbi:MAG: GGDEF domain-containing protein [Raoultibacter sp.]
MSTVRRKFFSKDNRVYPLAGLLFLVLTVAVGIACFQYYLHLQDTVKTEAAGYMTEISKQMSTNARKTIDDNFSVLGTVATVLEDPSITTYDQLQALLTKQRDLWHYQKMMLIDSSGVSYDDQGNTVALENSGYIGEAAIKKQPAFSTSQIVAGQEAVIFAIPLNNVVIEGKPMLALATSYDSATFDTILSMSAFDGQGYAHIVRKDGSVVVRSSSSAALETGYNILNSLSEGSIVGANSWSGVKSDIAAGKSGQIEFHRGSDREYMTYLPLGTQEWSLLTFVPVSVVNAKSDILMMITVLLCGFVTLAFALLTAFLLLTFYRSNKKLERIAYVDPVTGGNTIQRFYARANDCLKGTTSARRALVYVNIEKFKVLNEQFGKDACNEILRSINVGVGEDLAQDECLGRQYADSFCVLVHYADEETLAFRFDSWCDNAVRAMQDQGFSWIPLTMKFGIFVIDDTSMPFPYMIDRAKLALDEAPNVFRSKMRYAIYDEQMRQSIVREKQLEDMMESALAQGEFQVYFQPKYTVQTEQVAGAEALVRWESASEGMLYPDEFITLFEKNGFITRLDFWVFEQVCKTLRRWIDAGLQPVKISVNCSRIHLRDADFIDHYQAISEKYNIPKRYLEIELTENTVFEDVEHLSQIIDKIRAVGFGCSMDDFGSGYSSLNLIQDIPVDTLKLDRVFFRNGVADMRRSEAVVKSIISMAKALSMETVAEGIEKRFQVDMLKRLHCDYIQGYFFARPMPIPQFEQLMFSRHIEDKHSAEEEES